MLRNVAAVLREADPPPSSSGVLCQLLIHRLPLRGQAFSLILLASLILSSSWRLGGLGLPFTPFLIWITFVHCLSIIIVSLILYTNVS